VVIERALGLGVGRNNIGNELAQSVQH